MTGTDLEKTDQLTPKMRMGAWADAQGMPVKEIAELVHVHEKTISHWRGKAVYLEERTRWQNQTLDKLDNMIAAVKASFASAAATTVEVLLKALQADRDDGTPNWGVRIEAAKVLSSHPATRLIFAIPDDGGQGANIAAAVQTVNLHIHPDGTVRIEAEGEEILAAEEDVAEVEE